LPEFLPSRGSRQFKKTKLKPEITIAGLKEDREWLRKDHIARPAAAAKPICNFHALPKSECRMQSAEFEVVLAPFRNRDGDAIGAPLPPVLLFARKYGEKLRNTKITSAFCTLHSAFDIFFSASARAGCESNHRNILRFLAKKLALSN